jgi:broad-specificity NMP kinase
MRFDDWKMMVRESLAYDKMRDMASQVLPDLEKDLGKLYTVPDFDTFEREGEPSQQSNLFTNRNLHTFSFNYTTKGQLFSVDFWKPEDKSSKPAVTLYYHKGDLKKVMKIVTHLAKNPSKNVRIEDVLKENLNEDEEIDIDLSEPKPQKSVDPAVKKADKKVDDYDFGDPETIFEDLKTYVKMVISGKQPSLLVTGSPGVGKTYLVTEQLKKSSVPFIHIKGRSTAAGMYTALYDNNGKILLFDDCDSIFSSDDAVNILKGALDSYGDRSISWLVGKPIKSPTTGQTVPTSFEFTGRVIFISNLPQRKINDAIKSRSFVIEVALSSEDMIKKMKKELPNVLPGTPGMLKQTAMSFIERTASKTDTLELNMRTLIKAIKIIEEVDDLSIAERLIMQQCSYK